MREGLEECVKQGIFDLIIWVDASEKVESAESFNIDKSCADIVIDNNFLSSFKERVYNLGLILSKWG
jgi:hypothetical protein